MVTEIQCDERHASFHQPPRQQGLLMPQVLPVPSPHRLGFPRQIECVLRLAPDHHFHSLPPVAIQGRHRTALVEIATQFVEVFHQAAAVVQSGLFETRGQPEHIGTRHRAGIHTDRIIDRQLGRLIAHKRVIPLAQVSGCGDVRTRLDKGN